jgi:uncharacterized coiled-coil protein SlyX
MRTHRNGTLAQAMALLIQNQAAFVAQLGETRKWRADMESRMARLERGIEEIKAVLVRHEQILTEHSRILAEHSKALKELLPEILAQLPEAVRRKIGFKPK